MKDMGAEISSFLASDQSPEAHCDNLDEKP